MMNWLLNLLSMGTATLTDDTGDVQTLQVTEGATGDGGHARVTDKVPRLSEYGFASAVPDDTEVLVIRQDGQRSTPVVIATLHRASRPTNLPKGDVWLYDLRGFSFKLTEDGPVIDGGGGPVTVVNASKIRAECDIETTGDIISRCDGTRVSLNALRDAYDVHDHPPIAAGASWGSGPPNDQV